MTRRRRAGARAFALDTRSKRRWETPPLDPERAKAFRAACKAFGFSASQVQLWLGASSVCPFHWSLCALQGYNLYLSVLDHQSSVYLLLKLGVA